MSVGPATTVTTVRAAGGVVWRTGPSGEVEVLVVHRPKYDDWSLPKGKRESGESDEDCALREVEEESGYRCSLGPALGDTSYIDRKGRPKTVRWWVMTVLGGGFSPNDEVDWLDWLTPLGAKQRLSYDRDCVVVDDFLRG